MSEADCRVSNASRRRLNSGELLAGARFTGRPVLHNAVLVCRQPTQKAVIQMGNERFPDDWDDEEIKAAIKQIVNDKSLKVPQESGEHHESGRDVYVGMTGGIKIEVIVEHEGGSHVHTAYPVYND